jgi:hypothetical protein
MLRGCRPLSPSQPWNKQQPSHDWSACPFSHKGEKARRRDPRVYHYQSKACPSSKRVRRADVAWGAGCAAAAAAAAAPTTDGRVLRRRWSPQPTPPFCPIQSAARRGRSAWRGTRAPSHTSCLVRTGARPLHCSVLARCLCTRARASPPGGATPLAALFLPLKPPKLAAFPGFPIRQPSEYW